MSASDKKKQRKAELAGSMTQREQREQAEAKAAKRNKIVYTVIGVVCVAAAVALLVWNNMDSFHNGSTAATVDGEKYTVSDLQYYYNSARNSVIYQNQYYAAYYGFSVYSFDSGVDDGAQWYNEEEGKTWADYFRESALSSLKQVTVLCNEAEANGYTLSEDGQKEIDEQFEEIDLICAQNGLTRGSYFAQVYGRGVNEKVFTRNLQRDVLASEYADYHEENISYDDDALEAYYQEHTDTLDSYDYRVFTIDGSPELQLDADGNTIEATDEETEAAMAEAKEKADAAVAEIEGAGDREQAFIDAAPSYVTESTREAYLGDDSYSLKTQVRGSNLSSSTMGTWLMDADRKSGDVTAIETSTGYQIVLFLDRYRVEDPTVNIRHILIMADTDEGAETNSNGVAIPTQEQMDAAKAELQTILDEWNAKPDEEKTAEAFGELAEEYSDDGGSNTNGGRYTYVYKGQMVANFDAWCFDESRQPGDVGMVENSGDDASYYGWHLIYFESEEAPYWKTTAISAKQSTDQSEWLTALTDAAEAVEADGMKYVGASNTAVPTATESPAETDETGTDETGDDAGTGDEAEGSEG